MQEWEKSQLANVIVMAGAGEKAFCAGGDVAVLAQLNKKGEEGQVQSRDYFALEYRLDNLIATYSKPYVAYMDGITMGGGAGLSIHAPFRIATERTNFAFPETRIGFFPDVGASFFLPRLDGYVGRYLALTGESVKGVNVFYSGIATHYMHSTSLGALTTRLAELQFNDYASLKERLAIIDETIEEFGTGLPHDQPMLFAGELRRAIDRCFKHNTVDEICQALSIEARSGYRGSQATSAWADYTLRTIRDRSPTSLKVTLRALQSGSQWNISTTFKYEHYIASQFMKHPDFVNGITHRLITKEKGRPKWDPSRIEDVTKEQVDAFFPPEGTQQLELFSDVQYTRYPYDYFGLPRDGQIRRVVANTLTDQSSGEGADRVTAKDKAVAYFLQESNGKLGVREKVEDYIVREELLKEEERSA